MSKSRLFSTQDGNDIESLLDQTIEGESHYSDTGLNEQKLEINLIESDDEFIIEAPLPGVPYKNIRLSLVDDTLTIEADHPETKKLGKTIYQEFSRERVSRSIVLPKTFESGSEKAELTNGLLVVHIKKRKKSKPHEIDIIEQNEQE